jgi:predicted phage terminase large subunit-like protein
LEELDKRRAELAEADPTERLWYAQFQNDPLPDSLGLFKQPSRYTELPSGPFRTLIGIDMSYSPARRADHFALVVMKVFTQPVSEVAADGTARMIVAEVAYVVAVWRERWDPAMVDRVTHLARAMFPGGKMYSYMSGPEIGIAHYLAEKGIAVDVIPARYSKRQRAQKSIDKANAARILFPASAPWVEPMIARMILFTGADNAGDDDEVDALVSAVDGGMLQAPSTFKTFGKRRI